MQNEQTRTYLATGTVQHPCSVSFRSSHGVAPCHVVCVSRRCGNQCCASGSSLTCMFERANQTHFYLLPTPCFGFAPYGTCIHSSLQYANPLRAPIIRAGSVCAARHERTFVCARCHPAPGSAVRAQCTPIWARRCHPQCHRQTHCRPLRDVTTHRRSA